MSRRRLPALRESSGRRLHIYSVLWLLLASSSLLLLARPSPQASAFQSAGQFSSTEIGQKDFLSSQRVTTQYGLSHPFGLTFDSSGNLWVVEEGNNRVLEFKSPLHDGMNASLVIGQRDFTSSGGSTTRSGLLSPASATFDSSGDLWVADRGDDRVLEFVPPFTDGMNASLELGQPAGGNEFASNAAAVQLPNGMANPRLANGFSDPVDIAFDSSGDLWVADRLNYRVVEFQPPFIDGMNASKVVGEASLVSSPNNVTATRSSLWAPEGLTFDAHGNLWVADEEHNRVVEFSASSLGANGPPASLEIGQPDGPSQFLNNTGADTPGSFLGPFAVSFDSLGDLWVSDHLNNRVLEFKPPFTDGESASAELGQAGGTTAFTNSVPATNQTSLDNPLGIAFDPSGDLWVVDQDNNRVLEFESAAMATDGATVIVNATTLTSPNASQQLGGGCHQVARENVCFVTSDQTSVTGVKVELAGVASASTIDIYSSYLGSAVPPDSGGGPPTAAASASSATGLTSSIFYGVAVSGLGNGTAKVCISSKEQGAEPSGGMAYLSGGSWATPTGVAVGSGGICGTIPLSALSYEGTAFIAIGAGRLSSQSMSGFQASTALLVIAAIALLVALATTAARRGRKGHGGGGPMSSDDDDGELDEWG